MRLFGLIVLVVGFLFSCFLELVFLCCEGSVVGWFGFFVWCVAVWTGMAVLFVAEFVLFLGFVVWCSGDCLVG